MSFEERRKTTTMLMRNIILTFLGILLTSCVPNIPSNVQILMITSDDIPSGWASSGFNFSNKCGGKEYTVGFDYDNSDDVLHPRIGHHIIVYSNNESAIEGYYECRDLYLRDFMFIPNEKIFSPSSQYDLLEYKCNDSVKINESHVLDCLVLQQHNNYVSIVDIRMGEPLSYKTLNSTLEAIDRKLNDTP